jgi:hypothetical protein
MIPISIESIPNTDKLNHKNLSTETTLKTKLSSVLCVVLMSWPISGFTQTWMGLPDCGKYLEKSEALEFGHKMYALGYISSINLWKVPKKDILQDISAQQVWLYVENYCRKNPLDKINAALDTLIIELIKK